MHRQPDGLGLIGQRALDGLRSTTNRTLKVFRPWRIKLLHRFHQADVALADQIQQRQPDAFVIPRNLHDEAQVRLIMLACFLSPFLMRAAKAISSTGVSSLTCPTSRR